MAAVWPSHHCSLLRNNDDWQSGLQARARFSSEMGWNYGENHRVLRAQQLQKKGNEVDTPGRMREGDSFQLATKEVGLMLTSLSGRDRVIAQDSRAKYRLQLLPDGLEADGLVDQSQQMMFGNLSSSRK